MSNWKYGSSVQFIATLILRRCHAQVRENAMIEELNGDFLQWLRGFYYVASTGSVRKAAQLMNRNPSTISYQLRCLEQELNVILFERFKRTMRITAEGRKLLAWTISTFETLKGMRSSVSNASGELKGEIRVAATLPILSLAVPAIKGFIQKFPQVEILLEREIATTIRHLVDDCEVDFGLMPTIRPMERLELLFTARPLLVYCGPWNIAQRPGIDDLRDLPFISFPSRQEIANLGYFAFDSPLGELIRKQTILTVNNNQAMLRFIASGLGVGIIDEAVFKTSVAACEEGKFSVIALDHLLPSRLYGIYTLPSKRMNPQSLELLKVLRIHLKECAGIFQENSTFKKEPELENRCSDSDSDCGGD